MALDRIRMLTGDPAAGVGSGDPEELGSTTITFIAGSSVAWTNQPAAETEIFDTGAGTVQNRRVPANLAGRTGARLYVSGNANGSASSELRVQYSLNGGGSWAYLDGAAGPAVAITSISTTVVGTRVLIAEAAKTDVLLRVVGVSSNGTGDPAFGLLALEID